MEIISAMFGFLRKKKDGGGLPSFLGQGYLVMPR
jgi:hypothetical protein